VNRTYVLIFIASIALASCGSNPRPETMPDEATGDGHADHEHDGHADHGDHGDGANEPETDDGDAGDPTAPTGPTEPAPPDPATIKADLLAAETAAFDAAKPVFDTFCSKCHMQGGKKATAKKLGHFDMTTYPFGGHHAMEIGKSIRTSLGIDGSKPTMPADSPGSVKGDDLAAIAAWADAFDASHAGGAHEGMSHEGHGGHSH
jgi:hypothetical protein